MRYPAARDEMIMRIEGVPLVVPDEAPVWCRGTPYLGSVARQVGLLLVDDETAFAVSRYRTSTAGVYHEKVATVLVKGRGG